MEQKQILTVSMTLERRIKELQNTITLCNMLVEISNSELLQLKENADKLMENKGITGTGPEEPK